MRDRLIDGLIQGDRLAWAAVGALWTITAIIVLVHRRGPTAGDTKTWTWTWLLLAATTATSLAGLPLSAALAVPRVRWTTADAPELVSASGETWRKLRGPVVLVSGPDVAVPTIDAAGRWVLVGVLSGEPVPGLPPADGEPSTTPAHGPRLCRIDVETCRAWPAAWPDPSRPFALGELAWSRAGALGEPVRAEGALAYDVEGALYLRRTEPASHDGPRVEMIGHLTEDPPRDGAGVLFVLRKMAGGRLTAVRVLATPSPTGAGHAFERQRAEVSLTTGPRLLAYAVRPLLAITSFALPLGVLAVLLAPLLHRWIRRRRALPREASAWIAPYIDAVAVFAAGLAAAAPAIVAMSVAQ